MELNENPVYERGKEDYQGRERQDNDQSCSARYRVGDIIRFVIVVLAVLLFGAAAYYWNIPGHMTTFAGAFVVALGAGWKAGRVPKNYLAIFGASLAAIGGVISGIQTDLLQEKLLIAIKGGDAVPYLTFHQQSDRSILVKTNYAGKYPVFDVQFELTHLEKEENLNREGKPLKEIQKAVTQKVFLYPQNLIPGSYKKWTGLELPEDDIVTYEIFIITRNNIFKEYCRLVRLDDTSEFVASWFVIDPSEDRKILAVFHDPAFPKDSRGKFNWPKADSIVPPLPELEAFEPN